MTDAYSSTAMQSVFSKVRPTPGLVVGAIAVGIAVVARGDGPESLVDSLVVVAALIGSVLAHELSHAVVARRAGMAVDAIRVSLLGGGHLLLGARPRAPGASPHRSGRPKNESPDGPRMSPLSRSRRADGVA